MANTTGAQQAYQPLVGVVVDSAQMDRPKRVTAKAPRAMAAAPRAMAAPPAVVSGPVPPPPTQEEKKAQRRGEDLFQKSVCCGTLIVIGVLLAVFISLDAVHNRAYVVPHASYPAHLSRLTLL